jgi:magnesium transporter
MVFGGGVAPTERIYLLRREASEFYRAVHPLLGPLEALERGVYLQLSQELTVFLRDVNDHLQLINEEVIGLREQLGAILQANIAVISNHQNEINVRQNETMKVLTVVATVFLPLTFITGFFGMNFEWETKHIESEAIFLIGGVASLIVSCAVLYIWFVQGGHIEAPAPVQQVRSRARAVSRSAR